MLKIMVMSGMDSNAYWRGMKCHQFSELGNRSYDYASGVSLYFVVSFQCSLNGHYHLFYHFQPLTRKGMILVLILELL